jgi:predicted AAA+ superfamily ATPase
MAETIDLMRRFNPWWKGNYNLEYKERDIYSEIKKFLDTPQIIALTGLRRVGKSTIMKKIVADKLSSGLQPQNIFFFSFDDFKHGSVRDILIEYENLYNKKLDEEKFLFLFDEVQKVDNWQEQIKIIYDLYKGNVKIIISGSESLFIRKRSKESLAGRIFEFKIDALTFKEFLRFKGIDYKPLALYQREYLKLFEEFILCQGFPEIVDVTDKEHVRIYIKEGIKDKILYKDIPSLFKIEDISVLDSILENITDNPGQLIELTSFAGEYKISRPTLANYLRYLEESFLIKKLYNFSKNKRKIERKLKKYYPVLISPEFLSKDDPLSKSRVFENAVINALDTDFFWRDPYKHEVDAILNKKEIVPIEIKFGKIDFDGLIKFMEKFKIKEGFIISNQEEREQKIDNKIIKIVPAWKWLLHKELKNK